MIDEPRPSWLPGLLIGSVVCFGGAVVLDRACVARAAPPVIEWDARPVGAPGPPAPPHPVLYDGPAGQCQSVSDRPWWWVDETPSRLGALLYEEPTQAERALVETAIDGCAWTNRAVADPWLALALVRIEADAGAPPGLLLAAWCREASMRTQAVKGGPIRGDWHDGIADAVGPMQLHAWFRAWCGGSSVEAADLIWSATCYLSRILDQIHLAAACPEPWRAAEAWVANSPRYMPLGCRARSKHWETLEGWR